MTPPMVQLNTPYPATTYLLSYLKLLQQKSLEKNGHSSFVGLNAFQRDPALDLILKCFSKAGLQRLVETLKQAALLQSKKGFSDNQSDSLSDSLSVRFFLNHSEDYINTVESVIKFLQGKDPTLAMRILGRHFLPEGPRFRALSEFSNPEEQLQWAFGVLGVQDQAKYLCSLYLDDLADVLRDGVDEQFAFTRYAEKLAASAESFDPLLKKIKNPPHLLDHMIEELMQTYDQELKPDLVCLSVPFPGNVYAAFRIAAWFRQHRPEVKIILGGGYVNTELRALNDPRVFEYIDAITYDDGEKPLELLIRYFQSQPISLKSTEVSSLRLLRTRMLHPLKASVESDTSEVIYVSHPEEHDIPQQSLLAPNYEGLRLTEYLSVLELLNPMHRLWSDGRWNKLTLAHGCYWRKCNFCDVSLDYIARYDPDRSDGLLKKIRTLTEQTGHTGFHFVDEAAPPKLLKQLSQQLIDHSLNITWWGNVRFEQTFDAETATLMAKAGCVALSGGLEVASNRLLKLMNKGVSVEQVARVTYGLSQAGILVHAYLMYGFPSQTVQETIDALEMVRQLFEENCIQSAYWHRFSATIHSPVGKNPEQFGILLQDSSREKIIFAQNDRMFTDTVQTPHDELGDGLKRALYNYMHGLGFDLPLSSWFEIKVPKTTIPKHFIKKAIAS